ncbi:MAG: hypothetical protein WDN28_23815 [Chthoniobacter sp.]
MNTLDPDEQFYRDTESVAFPKLDDRQLAMLEPLGRRRIVKEGEVIYRAGQRDYPWPSSSPAVWRSSIHGTDTSRSSPLRAPRFRGRYRHAQWHRLPGQRAGQDARIGNSRSSRRRIAARPGGIARLGRPLVNAFIMRRERLRRDPEFAGLRVLAAGESHDGHHIHDFLDKKPHPAPVHRLGKSGRSRPRRAPAPGQPPVAGVDRCELACRSAGRPCARSRRSRACSAAWTAKTPRKSPATW